MRLPRIRRCARWWWSAFRRQVGRAVAAFVALRPGESADDAALMAFARGRLAGYKVPKSVHFIDEVPKSPVGKLLRRAVRDPFWKGRERRVG